MNWPPSALIMAGGLGTRLSKTHGSIPKPLLPLSIGSLIAINIEKCLAARCPRIYVSLGYAATTVEAAVRRLGSFDPTKIQFVRESAPLGTVGALTLLPSSEENFLVLNADVLNGIRLDPLFATHQNRGADLTIAVHLERSRLSLGEVVVNEAGEVLGYVEKPEKAYTISSGTYVVGPRLRYALRKGEALGADGLVHEAHRAGLVVWSHAHDDPWVDVNAAGDIDRAEKVIACHREAFSGPRSDVLTSNERPAWLGLDIGGTKISGVLLDEKGAVLRRHQVGTEEAQGPERVLARVDGLVRDLIGEGARPRAIGVGFAGLVDPERGEVRSSIMLRGFAGLPLASRIGEAHGVPVVVDNDATAAGFGEYVSLGEPADLNLIVVSVGTGIGGAIILGGGLYRGRLGTAGEIGNMSIDWRGQKCWCGSTGCLNTLASGTAMRTRGLEAGIRLEGREATPSDLMTLADSGHVAAGEIVADAAECLGAGIANLVNLLNPDRVALCGGVVRGHGLWWSTLIESVRRRAFAEPRAAVEIAVARLGSESAAMGAAYLAKRKFDPVPGDRPLGMPA